MTLSIEKQPIDDMNYFTDIPHHINDNIVSVVEIPRGSNAKYEYNTKFGFFELDRCLITAMNYPANYGFIPQTLGEDGDPLDCIIFTDVPLQCGTVVTGKAIAVLKMTDKGIRDEKILIVPKFNKRYNDYKEIKREYLEVYADFFQNYKNLTSKNVTVYGWSNRNVANKIITKSVTRFEKRINL